MRVDIRCILFFLLPIKRSFFSVIFLLMREALGRRVIAVGSGDLIAFTELLAGCDHPVGKIEHCPLVAAGFVRTGFESNLFKPNLFYFVSDLFAVIFGCKFILIVVHFMLLWQGQNKLRTTNQKGVDGLESFFDTILVKDVYLCSAFSPFL